LIGWPATPSIGSTVSSCPWIILRECSGVNAGLELGVEIVVEQRTQPRWCEGVGERAMSSSCRSG
jgi:hypothetical protein